MNLQTIEFKIIGVIRSCFKEKFGVPRQPGLVTEASAAIELFAPFSNGEAVRGLESFTHLWVIFLFHKTMEQGWRPSVRPPRLGGNTRTGVFASRSMFRPNPIGMSAVKIQSIGPEKNRMRILVQGGDFLDGTPVLDIKPYVPWSDAPDGAGGGFAARRPENGLEVVFSDRAAAQCERKENDGMPNLALLIEQVVALDPRPPYHGGDCRERVYGMRLFDFDVKWKVAGKTATILSLEAPVTFPAS